MNLDTDALNIEKADITAFLSDPNAYQDPNYADKSRRLTEIDNILQLASQISQLQADIQTATADPSLSDLLTDIQADLTAKQQLLNEILIP
jgi:hypothetical protein